MSLERALRGLLEPKRLVELRRVDETSEKLERESTRKRLGVFWHTQGSGKSLSMVFFT